MHPPMKNAPPDERNPGKPPTRSHSYQKEHLFIPKTRQNPFNGTVNNPHQTQQTSHGKNPAERLSPSSRMKKRLSYATIHSRQTLIPCQPHEWWGRPDSNRGSRGPKPRIVPSLTTTPARTRTQPAHIKLTNRTSPGSASAQPAPADPPPPVSSASHPHRCSRGSSCCPRPSSPPSPPDDRHQPT